MALEGFQGRWALVTGAGDGIGRALACGAAACGVKVIAADIREDAAEAVAAEIRGRGGEASPLVLDVSDRDAQVAAAERLKAEGRTPALVFANAGVAAASGFIDASRRTIEWVMGVNVLGLVWTAQAFAPALRDLPGPRALCVTASINALIDVGGPFPLYAASKHAAAGIAEGLKAELAPHGVGVTILYPGRLNTGIWDAARARPERFGGVRRQPFEVGEGWRNAASADVVVAPTFASIDAGGGRVVLDVLGDGVTQFEARTESLRAAFRANAP